MVLAVGEGGEVAADSRAGRRARRRDRDIDRRASADRQAGPDAPGARPGRRGHGHGRVRRGRRPVGSRAAQGRCASSGGRCGRARPGGVRRGGRPPATIRCCAFAEGVMLGSYRYSEKSAAVTSTSGARRVAMRLARRGRTALRGSRARPRARRRLAGVGQGPGQHAVHAQVARSGWPSRCRRGREAGLTFRVWAEQELAEAGFGGIMAVGSGSARPPRLIELRYAPAGCAARHVVLVGKGITFDSGGLSLKPNDGMKTMKTRHGRRRRRDRRDVRAAPGSASPTGSPAWSPRSGEHAVGPGYPPGDVLTQRGGRTTEVLNTDAEGRLVLADAHGLRRSRSSTPDAIRRPRDPDRRGQGRARPVDRRHLRHRDELAATLRAAGAAAGERLWRMPLPEDYREALEVSGRRPGQHVHRAGRRLDHGRAVPARVRRRACPGPTSTSPAPRGAPPTTVS